ncbi:MAG: hypothetical protein JWR05_3476 [Mucilaginibacter sp.]|nr:hypothetical protein [Mucilaginibacter sp.]
MQTVHLKSRSYSMTLRFEKPIPNLPIIFCPILFKEWYSQISKPMQGFHLFFSAN